MARSFCLLSLASALLLLTMGAAQAHPIDELAQASYVGITSDAVTVELDLIPGEEVSAAFEREVQKEGFPKSVGAALHLTLDGKSVPLDTLRAEKREVGQRLFLRAVIPALAAGAHELRYENTYAPIKSGYLAATLASSDRVTIGEQHGDARQQELTIDFQVRAQPDTRRRWMVITLPILALLALLAKWWPAGRK